MTRRGGARLALLLLLACSQALVAGFNATAEPDHSSADRALVSDRARSTDLSPVRRSLASYTCANDAEFKFYGNKGSSSYTCSWFASNDANCNTYPNRNQHEACPVACGKCPWISTTAIGAPSLSWFADSNGRWQLSKMRSSSGIAVAETGSRCAPADKVLGLTGCVAVPGYRPIPKPDSNSVARMDLTPTCANSACSLVVGPKGATTIKQPAATSTGLAEADKFAMWQLEVVAGGNEGHNMNNQGFSNDAAWGDFDGTRVIAPAYSFRMRI